MKIQITIEIDGVNVHSGDYGKTGLIDSEFFQKLVDDTVNARLGEAERKQMFEKFVDGYKAGMPKDVARPVNDTSDLPVIAPAVETNGEGGRGFAVYGIEYKGDIEEAREKFIIYRNTQHIAGIPSLRWHRWLRLNYPLMKEDSAPKETPLPEKATPIVKMTPKVKETKSKKRGPRGPYKKRSETKEVKTIATPKKPSAEFVGPEKKFIPVDKLTDYCKFLPGVQATKSKFIVENAYFKGDIYAARDAYEKYFKFTKSTKPDEVLTWGSWLVHKHKAE